VRAEAIERISAEIYTRLAEDFGGDPAVSATFRELAQEEVQHAFRIRLLRNQYRSIVRLFARMERLEEEVDAIHDDAVRLREEVMRGTWGMDLGSIRPRLVAMEDRLHLHAERMAHGADPRISGFFEALAQQDHAHRRLLASAEADRRRA